MSTRLRSKAPVALHAADRARVFELAALALSYPDAELLTAVPDLRAAAALIEHDAARSHLDGFLGWLGSLDEAQAGEHYVGTFDLRRRSGLYLTYYLHGDTRKRGIALLTLKQRYRAHGLTLRAGELPDLLPVVLEFAAAVGPGDGEAPLRQHRRGLELLREALAQTGTPYVGVLDAVCQALPPMTAADRAALAALAADGPPVETVGLDELSSIGVAPYPTQPSHQDVS